MLTARAMQAAIAEGRAVFDFLRGDDPYKKEWTGGCRTTTETVVYRAGWRGVWLRALDTAAALRQGRSTA